MGWLANRILTWSTGRQEKEIVDFVQRVSAADSSELGLTVAMATTYRHIVLRETGLDLLQPAVALITDSTICLKLSCEAINLQKNREFVGAATVIIWLHTMRAISDLKLRPYGRQLWSELSHAFPYVKDAADNHRMLTGRTFELWGYDQIPEGLGPRT